VGKKGKKRKIGFEKERKGKERKRNGRRGKGRGEEREKKFTCHLVCCRTGMGVFFLAGDACMHV